MIRWSRLRTTLIEMGLLRGLGLLKWKLTMPLDAEGL